MTILITGATGTVGRHIVRHLLDLGETVRCLTRNPAGASFPDGVDVVQGDLKDPTTLDSALQGVNAAHLITFAGDDFAPITEGEAIVARLEEAGVTRITLLTGDTEESPIETAVATSSLAWTSLAPVEFMANMLEWVDGAHAGRIEEGFVDVPSTVVHESDVARVAAHVLAKGGYHEETLWITGPEALTARERISAIEEATGQSIELVSLSTGEVQEQWRSYGFSEDDIAFMTQMKTDPPEAATTPQDTVARVTGLEALTFRRWAEEHAEAFAAEPGTRSADTPDR
ncbi:MAG: NAD(P)H-binding protein [Corynebacterium sp.]|uniref:SDR family oxidoreductase n=1 Tax=Corynebacterium sp. TaxID=1720 RepID=UPI0026472D07|nr:NAD(P)H-binding protein [Corynebacterium sp.]MDN5722125.1 NAD(P)H-binding protein [Corynebacterium sp.]MDN6281914.1 NAD(P)H-binding protein [Corynebacterium sp.]MDN6305690.1 NAD(P)H-binding protein [Corynebacterium sp.]MDN6352176.1 NAD(P)H-binding protein [Corynebacterium sp.]MDN6366934.1 NAD(P)H-binding protein [Corynebacterium sp.]